MTSISTAKRSTAATTDEALAQATTTLHLDAADRLARLVPGLGARVWPGHPEYDLVSHLIADLISAGLPLSDAASSTGGVLVAAQDDTVGPTVRWTTHAALRLDHARRELRRDIELMLNFALDDVLCALRWQTEPSGPDGAHLVTGRLPSKRSTGGSS